MENGSGGGPRRRRSSQGGVERATHRVLALLERRLLALETLDLAPRALELVLGRRERVALGLVVVDELGERLALGDGLGRRLALAADGEKRRASAPASHSHVDKVRGDTQLVVLG